MVEQKISSLSFQEQKTLKPKIEDFILECLDGETQQSALDFVAYIKSIPGSSERIVKLV